MTTRRTIVVDSDGQEFVEMVGQTANGRVHTMRIPRVVYDASTREFTRNIAAEMGLPVPPKN